MSSLSSLGIDQDDLDRATVLGVPIFTLGGEKLKINDNIYELTDEIHNALSLTR